MAQTRIFNYGDTVTQAKVATAFAALLPALVYDGYTLSVATASSVGVASGILLLPNGILVQESTSFSIPLTFAGGAEDFTLVCTHVNTDIIGGVGATYSAVSGFLTTYADSTILGWVHYPGGGIPLTLDMIVPAPRGSFDDFTATAVDFAPLRFMSPLACVKASSDPVWISSTATYSAVPVPHIREEIAVIAGAPIAETVTLYFSVLAKSIPPLAVVLRHNTPITVGTDITVSVYDTAGVLVTSTAVTGSGSWGTSTVTLDPTGFTFTEGETFSVQLLVEGSGGDTILIEWVEVQFNPTP